MSCENCNPIRMCREGCCTGETGRAEGYGSKSVKDPRTGIRYDVCGALERDEETRKWGCSEYSYRPDVCRGFYCDRVLKELADCDEE